MIENKNVRVLFEEVWPCKITGLDLDRMASENTIDQTAMQSTASESARHRRSAEKS